MQQFELYIAACSSIEAEKLQELASAISATMSKEGKKWFNSLEKHKKKPRAILIKKGLKSDGGI